MKSTFADILKPLEAEKFAKLTIEAGNVFRVNMDKADGVTPKQGDSSRNKYFVVLGFDGAGSAYGGVIFNSRINQNLAPSVRDYHMPVSRAKYGFLSHDSFVDCSSLKTANPAKLLKGQYLGDVDEDDLSLIKSTVKSSPKETEERLALFGL
ncbi:MAG: hypothetical protein LBL94_04890 [Prevotellaceae bacterium]|jgi:hypothetical protein|nr:hypothetical protein [Prevotellaceae bacterium]